MPSGECASTEAVYTGVTVTVCHGKKLDTIGMLIKAGRKVWMNKGTMILQIIQPILKITRSIQMS